MLSLGVLVGLGGAGATSPRYTGAPIVRTFTGREMVGSPQTRHLAVSPQGLVYAGTVQGLTEYDGVSWRLIPKTEGVIVHNVGVDAAGRVWYAGKGRFGCLVPNASGILEAQRWEMKLPPADQDVGHVLNMAINGRDIYFVTQGTRSFHAHIDKGEVLRQIDPPTPRERFTNVFVKDGVTYALTSSDTYRIDGGLLVPAPEARVLLDIGAQSVWPRSEGGAWVVSTDGLRIWKGNDAPLVSEDVRAFLEGGRVLCGSPLANGTFALGTEQKGLLLVDAHGRILAHYDEDVGLGPTSNRIEAMATDYDGGVWLALYSGKTRLQAQTPAAVHDLTIGVHGRVECFTYHQGFLHVGTTQGVFVRDPGTGRFSPLKNAGVDAWDLVPVPEGLIVAGNDLRLVRLDGTVEIIEPDRKLFRSALIVPTDPDCLVTSTGPGQMRIYRRVNGKWRFETTVPDVREVIFDLAMDSEGWLWGSGDNRRSVVRIDWRKGVNPLAKIERFGPDQGVPVFPDQRRNLGLFLLDGKVEVTSINGLLRYDAASNRFVPDERVKGFDASKWTRAYPLHDGSLWLANAGDRAPTAIACRTGPELWLVEPLPYMGAEGVEPRVVFDDPDTRTIWLGYPGLMSYDRDWKGTRPAPPKTRLREIRTNGGEVLWGGAGPIPDRPLPYSRNFLSFDFASGAFQADTWSQVTPQYRTRLAGLESYWSPWTESSRRDYSRLPHGRYTFEVQARDGGGNEGPVTSWSFEIAPPWWRTWWAQTLAVVLIGLFAWAIIRLRTNALEVRAEKLQREIAARTAQLATQNTELARLHKLELDEKIAARLELLRYQLNPHFLFNTLASISAALPIGHKAREMVQRLSEFCRLTLHRSGDQDWTTLGEEFRFLGVYLDIDKSRWGDLLLVDVDCPEDLKGERMPQFLLLPLVENALKYGHAASVERMEVRVAARTASSGELVLSVANTGEWVDPEKNTRASSLGIGLNNLRERLARYYPGAHHFTFTHGSGWVTATLRLRRI